jgi:hypothetical protein
MMNINMENLTPLFLEPRKVERNYRLTPYNLAPSSSRVIAPKMCCWTDCSSFGGWNGTPLCEQHANDVWATVDAGQTEEFKKAHRDERIAVLRLERLAKEQKQSKREASSYDRYTEPGFIYYLRVGDLIKIGYTFYLEDRMKAYPPNSELLATHPGTRQTERQMHHKFLHLLKQGREWFIEGDDLMAHIEDVSSKFPLDKGYKFKQAVRLAS